MGIFSFLFGSTPEPAPKQQEWNITMYEISHLNDYPMSMKNDYARYIKTCMTTHPEERWNNWVKDHPSPLRFFSIAGINHRKGIKQYLGDVDCVLTPEPNNAHDPNAIRIEEFYDNAHLGYIPADKTSEVRQLVTLPHRCTATIYTQSDDEDTPFFIGRVCINTSNPTN